MEKVIKIGNQEVKLNNNVAWTMEYRDQFGKDIIPVIMPFLAAAIEGASTLISDADRNGELTVASLANALEGRVMDIILPMFQAEFVDLVVNVTWAMAKAANDDIAPPKQWVRQFDAFPLDTVGPAVFGLVFRGFVSSKNLERLKNLSASLKSLQPSISMTSSSQDSKGD